VAGGHDVRKLTHDPKESRRFSSCQGSSGSGGDLGVRSIEPKGRKGGGPSMAYTVGVLRCPHQERKRIPEGRNKHWLGETPKSEGERTSTGEEALSKGKKKLSKLY